eukprot:CAMPEP_0171770752 /NCGR_PEP_ID=MMETSP0991-20121206/53677_1 /TAXON_ID=483369 /ORGANISM="non described non described, Strain CCMP2098" /LENGTH=400 /DNA_ID=CAMNT_0012375943 /DNA_START=88 /DNA_END=1290 /DNA_ORIENTATION=-
MTARSTKLAAVKKEEEEEYEPKSRKEEEEGTTNPSPRPMKPLKSEEPSARKQKLNKRGASTSAEDGPFPNLTYPLPNQCHEARDGLACLHSYNPATGASNTGLEIAAQETSKNHGQQSVLDSLIRTILSQNTTDNTSLRAFNSLKAVFPTWEEVLAAPSAVVEDAIREGGLAEIKTARIKTILTTVRDEAAAVGLKEEDGSPPPLSLEYLHNLPTDEVKAALTRFKGVGPKTVSCVLMFTMQRPEFPVDTHVWRISKRLGWVPPNASREQTYEHMNRRVPDAIKYDLHVLLVEHGKRCPTCLGKNGRLSKEQHGPCPLRSVSSSSMPPTSASPSSSKTKGLVKVEKGAPVKIEVTVSALKRCDVIGREVGHREMAANEITHEDTSAGRTDKRGSKRRLLN